MNDTEPDAKENMIVCFKQTAGVGHAKAMLRLGEYYYESAEGGDVEEYGLAFEWMKKAAEQIEVCKFFYIIR
jgi:TPR repeat protein